MSAQKIMVYTDGSSRGNPGPGGFGAILEFGSKRMELSQGFRRTTNNRMELLAVIVALEHIKNKNYTVVIHSDSRCGSFVVVSSNIACPIPAQYCAQCSAILSNLPWCD